MIYLYDPRTNIVKETTYEYLESLTGKSRNYLMSHRSKGRKIPSLGCYILKQNTLTERKEMYSKEKISGEYWRLVEGSGGQYIVSNYGRVKRIFKTGEKYILPIFKKKYGYLEIRVNFKGKYAAYRISKLVAFHFLKKQHPGEVVRHKNGILTDNFAENLEWISRTNLGKLTGSMSKSKAVVQLDIQTKEIINEFRSAREAGRQCYLSYQAVLDNCNKKSKTSGGYIFMFLEEYEQTYNS